MRKFLTMLFVATLFMAGSWVKASPKLDDSKQSVKAWCDETILVVENAASVQTPAEVKSDYTIMYVAELPSPFMISPAWVTVDIRWRFIQEERIINEQYNHPSNPPNITLYTNSYAGLISSKAY